MPDNETAPELVNDGFSHNFQVDLRAHGFELTPALRHYATEHLLAKLDKHGDRIQAVIIRFDDVNGSKGGEDKVCRVEVLVPGQPPLVVEELRNDLRAAMDVVSDRLENALVRKLERRSDLPRQAGRKEVRNRKVL